MENTTVIKPFQKAGFVLIGIIATYIAISLYINDEVWDYLTLLTLLTLFSLVTRHLWTQRIIFAVAEVTFIKMMMKSDTAMPETLTLNYQDIDSVRLLGDHLFIHSSSGKINFPLKPKSSMAAKLKQAFESKGIEFEVNSCIA